MDGTTSASHRSQGIGKGGTVIDCLIDGTERTVKGKGMKAIHDPLVLVQGDYLNNIVTPTKVSQTYLDLALILKLP